MSDSVDEEYSFPLVDLFVKTISIKSSADADKSRATAQQTREDSVAYLKLRIEQQK